MVSKLELMCKLLQEQCDKLDLDYKRVLILLENVANNPELKIKEGE